MGVFGGYHAGRLEHGRGWWWVAAAPGDDVGGTSSRTAYLTYISLARSLAHAPTLLPHAQSGMLSSLVPNSYNPYNGSKSYMGRPQLHGPVPTLSPVDINARNSEGETVCCFVGGMNTTER